MMCIGVGNLGWLDDCTVLEGFDLEEKESVQSAGEVGLLRRLNAVEVPGGSFAKSDTRSQGHDHE